MPRGAIRVPPLSPAIFNFSYPDGMPCDTLSCALFLLVDMDDSHPAKHIFWGLYKVWPKKARDKVPTAFEEVLYWTTAHEKDGDQPLDTDWFDRCIPPVARQVLETAQVENNKGSDGVLTIYVEKDHELLARVSNKILSRFPHRILSLTNPQRNDLALLYTRLVVAECHVRKRQQERLRRGETLPWEWGGSVLLYMDKDQCWTQPLTVYFGLQSAIPWGMDNNRHRRRHVRPAEATPSSRKTKSGKQQRHGQLARLKDHLKEQSRKAERCREGKRKPGRPASIRVSMEEYLALLHNRRDEDTSEDTTHGNDAISVKSQIVTRATKAWLRSIYLQWFDFIQGVQLCEIPWKPLWDLIRLSHGRGRKRKRIPKEDETYPWYPTLPLRVHLVAPQDTVHDAIARQVLESRLSYVPSPAYHLVPPPSKMEIVQQLAKLVSQTTADFGLCNDKSEQSTNWLDWRPWMGVSVAVGAKTGTLVHVVQPTESNEAFFVIFVPPGESIDPKWEHWSMFMFREGLKNYLKRSKGLHKSPNYAKAQACLDQLPAIKASPPVFLDSKPSKVVRRKAKYAKTHANSGQLRAAKPPPPVDVPSAVVVKTATRTKPKPQSLLRQRVLMERYDGSLQFGTIQRAWHCHFAETGLEQHVLYRVKFDHGDQHDYTLDCLTTPMQLYQEHVNKQRKVAKQFGHGWYVGSVAGVRFNPDEKRNLWKIVYEDGDGEEFDDKELADHQKLFKERYES